MTRLYYTPPSDEIFEEVKTKAMELWTTKYPEATSPHYAVEKVDRIKDWSNVGDNMMTMVAMFDSNNQLELANMLSLEAQDAIAQRMLDGGQPEYLIPFFHK